MGHYDDYYDMQHHRDNIDKLNFVIRDVKEGKFDPVLITANIIRSDHVVIDVATFKSILNIISKIEEFKY